jgi:hypothetical protein
MPSAKILKQYGQSSFPYLFSRVGRIYFKNLQIPQPRSKFPDLPCDVYPTQNLDTTHIDEEQLPRSFSGQASAFAPPSPTVGEAGALGSQ